jgi:uncharacterized pyridoxamine 5'-phosphate oxidase family protein
MIKYKCIYKGDYMKNFVNFLKESKIFYLATIKDSNFPVVRPFGVVEEIGGSVYFCSGKEKEVVKQISLNPNVGVSATNSQGDFCKVSTKLTLVTDKEIVNVFLSLHPELLNIYKNNLDNFILLKLSDVDGKIFSSKGVYQING